MSADVLIDFDDLDAGTVVETQYRDRGSAGHGVTFRRSSYGDAGLPVVQDLPGIARSGTRALVIRNCSGEFCPSAVVGEFAFTRKHVGMYVGELGSATSHVTLYAYDVGGTVVASVAADVAPGAGITTHLEITRPTADIDAFEVRAAGWTSRLAIDDLTFDNPDSQPEPDFGLTKKFSPQEGLRQGFATRIVIDIGRRNGSSGSIAFTVGGLPDGVTATFVPPATTGSTVTLELHARSDAALTPARLIVITGTPATPSAGVAPRSIEFPITVAANFAIRPLVMDVPPCTPTTATLEVYVPHTFSSPEPGFLPAHFTGSVALSLFSWGSAPLPPGVELTFTPPSVTLSPTVTSAKVVVRVTSPARSLVDDAYAAILGTASPYPAAAASLTLVQVGGSLAGFAPVAGDTPRARRPGTEVVVTGTGYCPGPDPITVQFGNANAIAKAYSPSPDARQVHVNVPRLATTGPLVVKNFAGELTSATPFVVRSFRNTHGFKFPNESIEGFSYGDLSDAFGKDQTYVTITFDPCAPLPLVPSCPVFSISTIPQPFGWVVYWMATKIDARCYGMSVTSLRLLNGKLPYSSFTPPTAKTAWEYVAADHPYPALANHLRLTSATQLCSEVARYYLLKAGNIFASSAQFASEVPAIRASIEAEFAVGGYPLIAVRSPEKAHVVVAIDTTDGDAPDIAYYIHVYDPNTQFLASEDTDAADHKAREDRSRITVYTDGRWTLPWKSLAKGFIGPGYFHSNTHSLVVIPFSVIPDRPTFPVTPEGLLTFVFGSADITQLTDSTGGRLFNADGSPNADPATCIADAAPFALFDGDVAPMSAYLVGRRSAYAQTIRGREQGGYTSVLHGEGVAVHLDEVAIGPGDEDELSLIPTDRNFVFRTGADRKPVSVRMTCEARDGSHRTAVLKTSSHRSGSERLQYDAQADTIRYRHEGPATACTLMLGWSGATGTPSRFETPQIQVDHGDTLELRPRQWPDLDKSPVELVITSAGGVQRSQQLDDHAAPVAELDVRLNVRNVHNVVRLEIATHFRQLPADATAVVVWLVTHGQELVGQHVVALHGEALRERTRRDTWEFHSQTSGEHQFTGYVTVIGGEQVLGRRTELATARFVVQR
jgi:hypothetical protein